jgi:S-phase kinase-associated protein 1
MSNSNWSVNNNVGGGASKEDEPTQHTSHEVGGGGGSKEPTHQHMYTTMPTSHEVGGGASAEDGKYVVFVSSDGVEIKVPYDVAGLSGLVKRSMEIDEDEDGSMSGSEDGNESSNFRIELNNVSYEYLSDIVEFMRYYHENPMPEIKKPVDNYEKFIKGLHYEFYQNFAKKELTTMFELMNIANYMAVQPLLDLMCARVSCLKDLEEDELRAILGIPDDVPRLTDEIDVEVEEEVEEQVPEEVEETVNGVVEKKTVMKTVKRTVKKTVRKTVEEDIVDKNPWIEDDPSD